MGLFSSSESQSQHPPQDSVLKRSSRKVCWESRDKFFECLDSINVIDPRKPIHTQQVQKACAKEDAEFNKDCIASWVDYFKQKRVNEWERDQRIKQLESEGAVALGSNIRFK